MKPHVLRGQWTQSSFQQRENIVHFSALAKPAHAHIMKARRFLSAHWDCPCGLPAFRILTGIPAKGERGGVNAVKLEIAGLIGRDHPFGLDGKGCQARSPKIISKSRSPLIPPLSFP